MCDSGEKSLIRGRYNYLKTYIINMETKKYTRPDCCEVESDEKIRKTVSRLSELGYNVWESNDNDSFTDLIVERSNNELNRIKVYEGKLKRRGKCIKCDFDSKYIESNGLYGNNSKIDEVDVAIIYCDVNQRFYWVDIEETCGQGVILNIGENKIKGSNGKRARDYEL